MVITMPKGKKKDKEKAMSVQFTDWLYEQYNVSFLPKHFFMQLQDVYKGKYKGLNKPVPVEDLWDMWKRKMPKLLQIYDKNKRMGKDMDGYLRIRYDLAIILSKYDNYLQWKEEQKQANAEAQEQSTQTIDYNRITVKSKNDKIDKKKPFDINDIIDDI